MKPVRKRAVLVVLAVLLVLAGVLITRGQQIMAALLPRVMSLATGYDLSIGDQHIGKTHATFLHVHVSRNGDPLLDAAQVEVSYSLRDLLPGSSHRFGVKAIYIDHPTLTLVRHKDGTYNIAIPQAQNPTVTAPQLPNHVPIALNVRIRDGSGVVRAPYTVDPDSRTLEVTGINLDADINSATRTHYVLRGAFVEQALEPFQLTGTVDMNRGYAIHHAFAKAIPMRAIGNYFINSDAARLLAGSARDLEFKAYALDVVPDQPIDYHLSGAIDVADIQMRVVGLATPLSHIAGRLQMVDDSFFFNRLGAQIGRTPVAVSGGIYNFAAPQYRLGIQLHGNLQTMRELFTFTQSQPIEGDAHLQIEVQGDLGSPVVLARMDAPRAVYNTLPIRNMLVKLAYQNNTVMLAPLQATVHGATVAIRGMIGTGNVTRSQALLHFSGPAKTLPYFGALLGDEPIVGDVLLDGEDTRFVGYGAMQSLRGIGRMAAVLHVDRPGIVDVQPFWIDTERGRFAAAYHLNRQTNTSAFWMDAHHLALNEPVTAGAFGTLLPDLPAFGGTVDEISFEGGGPSGMHALIAGEMNGHGLQISGVGLDRVHALFSGTLSDAAIEPLNARGPWGTLDGDGALSLSAIAVSGMYHGTLQGLRPFLQDPHASGNVDGHAAIAIAGDRITVQAGDLRLHNAQYHGLPLQAVRGTLAVDNNGGLTVLSTHATIAGGDIVAAGRFDRGITLVANQAKGAQLRGLGLPLDAGTVSAAGSLKQGATIPAFDGGIAIAHGKMQQFGIEGTALVALHDDTVHLDHVVGALDGMYTLASGDLRQLSSGAPAYAVHANVPAADVTNVIHMLSLPSIVPIDGTYGADVDVGGRGLDPTIEGPISVGAGSVNGLPFTDASALITASRSGARARRGSVQVASTHVMFAAAQNAPIPGVAKNTPITGVHVRAPYAKLEDFNNFFDTGDTLAGTGPVRFDLVSQRHRINSNGNIDVAGLRYRNIDIGNTRAVWSTTRNLLKGSLVVGGGEGLLRTKGAIAFAPSSSFFDVLRDSRYSLSIDVDNVDTAKWLGAFGFGQVPVSGRLDADATIDGRFPRLHVNGSSSLRGGTIGPLPIEAADFAFSSLGDRIKIDSASMVSTGLTATASGQFGLAQTDPIDVDVYLNSNDMPRLINQVWRKNVQLEGQYESTLSIRGTPRSPQLAAAFDATDAVAYGVKIPSIFGTVRWNGAMKSVELSDAGAQFEHGEISLAGSLPLRLKPFGAGPPRAPVNVDLSVTALDPATFQTLLGNNTQLGGTIDGELAVEGTVETPRIYGRFALAKGSYVSDLDRTPVTNATATLTFDRTQATVQRLSANFGAGAIAASGHLAFASGAKSMSYRVNATAKNAQLNVPALGSGAFDGSVSLQRDANQLAKAGGEITLHDATIPFSAFLAATQGNGTGPPSFPIDLGFDLMFAAGKNVRVRGAGFGAGLDIGATGAVNLGGTLKSPTLQGQFVGTAGTLTYFDRIFRVTDAVVNFTPSQGIIPTLHAQGVTHVTSPDPHVLAYSTDVTINVDGPINGLKIAFSTNPPGYSNEQILAMIAPFGGLVSGTTYLPTGANNPTINGVTPQGALNVVPGAQPIGQPSSSISVGQEAFNILNAQFTAGVLAPVENVVSQGLGFQNFNLNVNYYGNVGFSATRLLGKTVNFVYSQTFGTPSLYSAGLQLIGSNATSAQLSFYWSTGPQVLFKTPAGVSTSSHLSVGQPLQGSSGFSFNLQRLYW